MFANTSKWWRRHYVKLIQVLLNNPAFAGMKVPCQSLRETLEDPMLRQFKASLKVWRP